MIPDSTLLVLLKQFGGGEEVRAYRGGLGIYVRLEGNTIVGRPLPLTIAFGQDGNEYWYPAAVVDAWPGTGYDLAPMRTLAEVRRLDPALSEACRAFNIRPAESRPAYQMPAALSTMALEPQAERTTV
jgi:hypothetical protein